MHADRIVLIIVDSCLGKYIVSLIVLYAHTAPYVEGK